MDNTLNEFACSITLITDAVKELRQIEEQKAISASEGRHDKMDGFLKQEQVFLLKLRGLEQNRLRGMEAMGWKALTFREILSGLPKAQKERLLPLFTDLDRELKLLLDAKDSADRMITLRLAEFQQALLKHGQANQLFERKA